MSESPGVNSGIETVPAIHAANTLALAPFDDGPRVRDLDLAERLGFDRPRKIRELIERNLTEIEVFGAPRRGVKEVVSGRGRATMVEEFWLNEEQALLVATLSKAPGAASVRAALIRTFVAWRRGQLEPATIDPKMIGGVVKGVVHKALAEILPQMIAAEIADQQYGVVRGMTAGDVIELAGVENKKGLRGLARKVSDHLRRLHAEKAVPVKVATLGRTSAYVFDPATVRDWLGAGGKATINGWIAQKRGQGMLRLVPMSPG